MSLLLDSYSCVVCGSRADCISLWRFGGGRALRTKMSIRHSPKDKLTKARVAYQGFLSEMVAPGVYIRLYLAMGCLRTTEINLSTVYRLPTNHYFICWQHARYWSLLDTVFAFLDPSSSAASGANSYVIPSTHHNAMVSQKVRLGPWVTCIPPLKSQETSCLNSRLIWSSHH